MAYEAGLNKRDSQKAWAFYAALLSKNQVMRRQRHYDATDPRLRGTKKTNAREGITSSLKELPDDDRHPPPCHETYICKS